MVQLVFTKEVEDVLGSVVDIVSELALVRQSLVVAVRHRARPAVAVFAFAMMLQDGLLAVAVPAGVLDERLVEDGLVLRPLGVRITTVYLSNGMKEVDDGLLGRGLGVSIDRSSGIGSAVELEEGIAPLALSRLAGTHTGDVVGVVVGAAHGGKGSETTTHGGIAGNHCGEPSAVGFARTVYLVRVHTETLLHVCQKVAGEVEIIRAGGNGVGVGQPVAICAVGIDGNAVRVELRVGELGQGLLLVHITPGAMEGKVDRSRLVRLIAGRDVETEFTVAPRQLNDGTVSWLWEAGRNGVVASGGLG